MERNSNVAIISRNSLFVFALKALCKEYLNVQTVVAYETVADFEEDGEAVGLLFVDASTWLQHADMLRSQTDKTVVLVAEVPTKPQIYEHDTHLVIPVSANYHEIGNFLKQYWGKEPENKRQHDKVLSLREEEVLKLVCTGRLNKEIADELNISMHTVISHRKNICTKLNIKSVPALTIYAVLNGIIDKEDVE